LGHHVVAYYGKPISAERIKEMGDEAFAEHLTHVLWDLQNEIRVKRGKEPFDYPASAGIAGKAKAAVTQGETEV
jgi:hypothetical protein